jgi:hypothetical protein
VSFLLVWSDSIGANLSVEVCLSGTNDVPRLFGCMNFYGDNTELILEYKCVMFLYNVIYVLLLHALSRLALYNLGFMLSQEHPRILVTTGLNCTILKF